MTKPLKKFPGVNPPPRKKFLGTPLVLTDGACEKSGGSCGFNEDREFADDFRNV
jgi:hypothetical protein